MTAPFYSFPVLPVSEVVTFLGNLPQPQPPLTSTDITEPTPATVQLIYFQFVEMLMGVVPDELHVRPDDEGPYPQLHEQSVPQSMMIKVSRALLSC